MEVESVICYYNHSHLIKSVLYSVETKCERQWEEISRLALYEERLLWQWSQQPAGENHISKCQNIFGPDSSF